ncbi:hypothetical protein RJ641_012657 [Dillenia turbinata]|uniref:WAT1-related protein n=1 Tax=Dillenia turbinata TaxID=194707 RepID=A0AAN8UUC9_9MAGN
MEKKNLVALAGPFVGMVIGETVQVGLMISDSPSLFPSLPQVTDASSHDFNPRRMLVSSCLVQISGYTGIYLSSATLCTAMFNLVPGITFVLAVISRMEKLDLKSSSSIAKAVGTIVSIAGAFVVTFYKGPVLLALSSNLNQRFSLSQESNWILGGSLLAADALMSSLYLIVQKAILKKYPAELVIAFLYCLSAAILTAIVTLIMGTNLSDWSLSSNVRLAAVLYSVQLAQFSVGGLCELYVLSCDLQRAAAGVLGYACQVGLCIWCLHKTGPVFVAMFKPLAIAIAIPMGVIFSGDPFYFGSLVGATIIVIGFYSVMWGKVKEHKTISSSEVGNAESSNQQTPLLQNNV